MKTGAKLASQLSSADFKNTISDADRARQFIPFMALKGYYELCRQKERHPSARHTPTEEESLELSRTVAALGKGDMIKVTYYDKDAYVTTQGMVSEVVPQLRFVRVVRQRIDFDDIRFIELVAPQT